MEGEVIIYFDLSVNRFRVYNHIKKSPKDKGDFLVCGNRQKKLEFTLVPFSALTPFDFQRLDSAF